MPGNAKVKNPWGKEEYEVMLPIQYLILKTGYSHQQIENEHIFKAIFEVDENVLPFILKKLNYGIKH